MRKRRPLAWARAHAGAGNRSGRRALSLLLSLVLALGLLPGAALAADTSTDTGSTKYYMDDVSEVLETATQNEKAPSATGNEKYDLDDNKLLTTWDAKLMLDTMPRLTGLTLGEGTLEMPVGSKARLNVTYTPKNSYDMRLNWESNNKNVATVEGGVVTAVGTGTAIITATSKVNKDATATRTVKVTGSAPSISVKALQISTKGAGSSEWADLEIQDGKLNVISRTKDSFTKTLGNLCDNNTRYPNAGALLTPLGQREKATLLLQTSYTNNVTGVSGNNIQVQVDPDSFAAPALSKKVSDRWYDATALSDGYINGQYGGRLLVVTAAAGTSLRNYFVTADGKEMVPVTAANGVPALLGIASAGKDNSGDEVLYGVTSSGTLYQLTLTGTGDEESPSYTLSADKKIGSLPTSEEIQSASLLYDESGYLLVSVSYATDLDNGESAGLFYLIDPTNPGYYYDLTQDDGAVFTSLYQYQRSDLGGKAGVYLYVDETPISLTEGSSVKLPEAEAYSFKTVNGLVTNNKLSDSEVKWRLTSDLYNSIATVDNDKRTITGGKPGIAYIQALATSTDELTTSSSPIKVTVIADTGLAGATVGALVDTSSGTVWAKIDLGLDDSGNLTFDPKGKADLNYAGGGYAQGKLWGFYSTSSEKKLYPIDAGNFTVSTAPGDKPISTGKNIVVDLTGAPKITAGIPYGNGKTVTDPASPVFVTSDGLLGLLEGNIWNADMRSLESTAWDYDGTTTYKLSAITYVGDLTAAQVRAGTKKDLSNCDPDTPCHVYYALTEDAKLRQLILVPQVDTTGTLSYTLCGKTIATVTGFLNDGTSTTSMDLLQMTDKGKTYLLVARSNGSDNSGSLWKIDITSYTYDNSDSANNTLEATKIGGLGDTVQDVTALYHTENTKLDKTQLLRSAGWNDDDTKTTTLSASRKAVSAEQGGSGAVTTAETIKVPIYASEAATNGLWTLKYDTDKLYSPVVRAENEAILYWSYRHYYPTKGIVRIAFAVKGEGLESSESAPLFTVTFTVKEDQTASTADVKITQRELNDKLPIGDNTGGNTGGSTVTPSKPETLPFTDVAEGSYCYDAVRWAVEKGVTEGVSETSFAPNEPCTRGQAVTFLWRAAGSPAPKGQEMPFTDVAESSPFAKAILWAAENGVTKGVTETTFAPNAPCTRGQIVTFLYRSQGAPAQAGSNPFTDVAEGSPYLAAILWAAENGVTKGVTETTFAPNNTCVRGQIVTFLYRLWS